MADHPTRRALLTGAAVTAGGLVLGLRIPYVGRAGPVSEVNAWVVVASDESVVIRIARSEMGQGTLTGLAQLVAEELECDWARVTTEYPSPATNNARSRIWREMGTYGSLGIRASQDYVRQGGATAREMLKQAAARQWNVAAGEIVADRGRLIHKASGRATTFGQVADLAGRLPVPWMVPLKEPKDWKIIGKPMPRLDTAPKLDGSQIYGIDLKLPGMLNAAIKACPVFGGTLASLDAAKAKAMPGVRNVLAVGGNAVAVVADTWWQARSALDAVGVVWNEGRHAGASSESFARELKDGLTSDKDVFVGNSAGDARAAIAGATRRVEADYSYPHQNHATLEPMNATALWRPDRCEVWCPTQNGDAALGAAARAAGLPPDKCDVHKLHLGGGFGRRGFSDYITQAVLIARQIPGVPVKLVWSREEDMTHGFYHPVTMARMTGALDEKGNLVGLHMRISGQSILATALPQAMRGGMDPAVFQGLQPEPPGRQAPADQAICYAVPALLIDHAMRNPHVPPGFWRGVNVNQNAIYLECFMDELAKAAGVDALEFRLRLLASQPKAAAVLKAVAEKGGWSRPLPAGVQGRGLALCRSFGSFTAALAEVSVLPRGKLKMHRIVAATDPGTVVNPRQAEMQVEGSFVYGLGAMLHQSCTVRNGRIVEQNFDTYPALKLDEMPKVETIVMPSGGWWGGVGEPTIAVAAPAVLNAIANATGTRIRNLPIKSQPLRG
ncbi:MAG: molybdopterin cofactor-binding domain-containing protein [Hyphomicrobiaceae bacterium]|nr:molybdopterin cofactor-binding domain-containing protein [Hyphomicrobiaceae bacterium]